MKKIITAEQFLKENNVVGMTDLVTPIMIEFAKLHVESALKAKVKAMTEKSYEDSSYSMNELDSFTRNSYPLEKIKQYEKFTSNSNR